MRASIELYADQTKLQQGRSLTGNKNKLEGKTRQSQLLSGYQLRVKEEYRSKENILLFYIRVIIKGSHQSCNTDIIRKCKAFQKWKNFMRQMMNKEFTSCGFLYIYIYIYF